MDHSTDAPRDQAEPVRSCSSRTTREDFLSRYETVSHFDSECLVGIGVTRQIVAACPYCFDLDERGVPEWEARTWIDLHRLVMSDGTEMVS